MLGFFSFTEVTDPSAHEAYNAWHQLDHLPEQFTIDGIVFGRRWVRSPRCRAAEAATGALLDRFHYMTLYLLRDESVVPEFFALAKRLHAEDRFFAARRALLSGPFAVVGRWAAPRVAVSAGAVPYRPAQGVHVVVGPAVPGAELVRHPGVAGAWQFFDAEQRPDHHGHLRRWRSLAGLGRHRNRWRRRARSGQDHWSELMPSAGTGSLR